MRKVVWMEMMVLNSLVVLELGYEESTLVNK